jgi:vacuolar-type H+-ATPase subunit H
MELIKKIKEAEAQAKEVIEQARGDAGRIADKSAADRNSKLEVAGVQRREAIESAIASAAKAGKSEVDALSNREVGKKQALVDSAKQKMDAAVTKIVAAIK